MNYNMKNIHMLGALLVGITGLFTSCSDDNGSNPTLIQPKEFTLNTPAYANGVVDLEKTAELNLTWSQPKFTADNAPINATYEIQVSPTNSFTVSTDEADADESGETIADYAVINGTTTMCNYAISSSEVAKDLNKILSWDEDNIPEEQEVAVRVSAFVQEGSKRLNEITSNSITLKVSPYYVELKDATPIMWYLVGNMFGGKWGNVIGESALPMFLKPNFTYDKKTGTGEIEYTNYFVTGDYTSSNENGEGGFKIQPSTFNWDLGMTGDSGKKGTIIYRNGGGDGGHILAPENGYYTIDMNTANNSATITKYEGEVTDYGTIQLSGSFNGWTDTPMLPYNTEGVENHAWYYVMTVTTDMYNADHGVCEFKFKIADSWDINWGYGTQDGAVNMYGKGSQGASNLGLLEGKYVISFNDITKAFSIVQL